MPTEIKNVRDLPEWFDIRRYDAAKDLDVIEWRWQFICRAYGRNLFQLSLEDGDIERANNQADQYLEQIIKHPIFPSRDGSKFFDSLHGWECFSQRGSCAVKSLSIMSAFFAGRVVGRWTETSAVCKTMFEEMFGAINCSEWTEVYVRSRALLGGFDLETLEELEKPYDLVRIEQKGHQADEVMVQVDLNASDEQLIDDFKAWLRSARQTFDQPSRQKRFTERDFAKWHRWRVLAYMDLEFWATAKGLNITDETIGKALFPHEQEVSFDDRVRRTVEPRAKKALSNQMLNAMLEQVKQEKVIRALQDKDPA